MASQIKALLDHPMFTTMFEDASSGLSTLSKHDARAHFEQIAGSASSLPQLATVSIEDGVRSFDKKLAAVPLLRTLEDSTGIPKVIIAGIVLPLIFAPYIILLVALAVIFFDDVFHVIGDIIGFLFRFFTNRTTLNFITSAIAFVFPALESARAVVNIRQGTSPAGPQAISAEAVNIVTAWLIYWPLVVVVNFVFSIVFPRWSLFIILKCVCIVALQSHIRTRGSGTLSDAKPGRPETPRSASGDKVDKVD
ncbi:hypothetical protein HGRIS_010443 [Hohenbuehelia grisea]|uniref:Uncharacterized protein n=1 Tax=Hohenbuehelia grisea TaxID=104357 RepID=A0ABR3IZH8_9AGAR